MEIVVVADFAADAIIATVANRETVDLLYVAN